MIGLAKVPGLMSAMQVGGVTGQLQGAGFYGWCTGAMLLVDPRCWLTVI